jgi:hypothetical protein
MQAENRDTSCTTRKAGYKRGVYANVFTVDNLYIVYL